MKLRATKEEKQAKRQASMESSVERRLQKEEERREKRGAVKQEDPHHIASLQQYEYRVLTEATMFGGSGDVVAFEQVLNGLAQEGWRVITGWSPGQVKAMGAHHSKMFIVLERPLPSGYAEGHSQEE